MICVYLGRELKSPGIPKIIGQPKAGLAAAGLYIHIYSDSTYM